MSADTPRTDLEPSEIDKAFGRILMFIAERSDPPNQEYLDAHNAVDFLREELDRRAPASASPPLVAIGVKRRLQNVADSEEAPHGTRVLASDALAAIEALERTLAWHRDIAKAAEADIVAARELLPAPRFTEAEREALTVAMTALERCYQQSRRRAAATLRAMLSPQGKGNET